MMKTKYLDLPFTTKSVDENGTFSGLAVPYGVADRIGDVITAGAFSKSIKKRIPAMLWQHKYAEPIGVYTELNDTEKGLQVEGQFCMEVQQAREAHALMKMNALSGLSVGFIPTKYSDKGDFFIIEEAELMEISVVSFPAYDKARVSSVKQVPDLMTLIKQHTGLEGDEAELFIKEFKRLLNINSQALKAEDVEAFFAKQADIIEGVFQQAS